MIIGGRLKLKSNKPTSATSQKLHPLLGKRQLREDRVKVENQVEESKKPQGHVQ
jgi:hypothetical protein